MANRFAVGDLHMPAFETLQAPAGEGSYCRAGKPRLLG